MYCGQRQHTDKRSSVYTNSNSKKVQLTLTNQRDAEACKNSLLQFDVFRFI